MGNIIGDLFGAGTNIAGGELGAKQALTGFNYLKGSPAEQGYISTGSDANSQLAALLGLGGNTAGANNAFQKYLGSSGYNFQLNQGQNAISSNAASKGLLNSGATGKALTAYGQGLASTTFNDYLSHLAGLSSGGQTALGQVGSAGTAGGIAGGEDLLKGYMGAGNNMTDLGSGLFGGSIFSGI